MERRGIPGVMVASEPFGNAARAQGRALGLDVARVLTPHPIQDRTNDEMRDIADAVIDSVVDALISP